MRKKLKSYSVNTTKIDFEDICIEAGLLTRESIASAIKNSDYTVEGINDELSKIGENIKISPLKQGYHISLIANFIPDEECALLVSYRAEISILVKDKEIVSYMTGNSAFDIDGQLQDAGALYEFYENHPQKFVASTFCNS